jgi:hypothetical protein
MELFVGGIELTVNEVAERMSLAQLRRISNLTSI